MLDKSKKTLAERLAGAVEIKKNPRGQPVLGRCRMAVNHNRNGHSFLVVRLTQEVIAAMGKPKKVDVRCDTTAIILGPTAGTIKVRWFNNSKHYPGIFIPIGHGNTIDAVQMEGLVFVEHEIEDSLLCLHLPKEVKMTINKRAAE
jgi:hypothetical protein